MHANQWSSWGLIIFLIATSARQALAQQAVPPGDAKYTLAQLVNFAVQHTRLPGSQAAQAEANRLAATQARIWPGVAFDFLAGRKRTADASGPRYELAMAQQIPLTGKPGLRGGLLDLESESWRVRQAASEILVTVEVVRLAYEYAANRRKAAFIETRKNRFELIREYLSGRVFPTPQRKAERHIVLNHLQSLGSEELQSAAKFKASLEKLRVYAPLDSGNYPEIAVRWLSGARILDEREWLDRALANNPNLRIQRLGLKSAELESRLARKDGLPDPSIVASYEEGRAADTEKDYGLGLSLAFSSWNSNRSGVRSADQRKLAEEHLLGFEEQKLRAEFARALVEYAAARQVAVKYPQALLSELETQLQEAEEGFRKGQVDLLTFLELDNSAAETFGRVLDTQVELAAKLAELFMSTQAQDVVTELESY